MPSGYMIDPQRRTVFTTVTGAIDLAGLTELIMRLRGDPGFDPSFRHVVDARGASLDSLFFSDMRTVAYSLDPFDKTSLFAMVVDKDYAFGIARMYQALRSDETTKVFYSREEALRWLGLEPGLQNGGTGQPV